LPRQAKHARPETLAQYLTCAELRAKTKRNAYDSSARSSVDSSLWLHLETGRIVEDKNPPPSADPSRTATHR